AQRRMRPEVSATPRVHTHSEIPGRAIRSSSARKKAHVHRPPVTATINREMTLWQGILASPAVIYYFYFIERMYTSEPPSRVETNANRLPSGDHAGEVSWAGWF